MPMHQLAPHIPVCILLLLPVGLVRGQDESPAAPEPVKIVEGGALHTQLRSLFPDAIASGQKRLVIEITPNPDGLDAGGISNPKIPDITAVRRFPKDGAGYTGAKGESKTVAQAITQAGNLPDIKIVALAPGDGGTTIKKRPTLWWFQSEQSKMAEIEFILTEISERPRELLRLPLKAMPAGFNSLDLEARWLDQAGITLQPDQPYQWTIALRAGDKSSAVYAKLRRVPDEDLATQLTADPYAPDTLTKLSETGNWYELFDAVARLARHHTEENTVTQARKALLDDAKLSKHLP